MKWVYALTAAVALAVLTGSCGNADKDATGASSPSSSTSAHATSPETRSILAYGQEASPADKQAITALVNRYYAAAAADDGVTACSLIYSPLSESVAEDYGQAPGPANLQGKTCEVVMSKLFRQLPEQPGSALAGTEVTGVRIKGRKGYALLRSKAIPEGAIQVIRELGIWKVINLIGSPLSGTEAPEQPASASKVNTHSNYEDAGLPKVKDFDSDRDPGSNDDEAIVDYGKAASQTDEKAIVALVKRFYAATSAANGPAICSLIYNVTAEALPESYEQSSSLKGNTCVEVMAKVFARHHQQAVLDRRRNRVTRVRVEGAKAVAIVRYGKHPDQYFLVHRQGPRWKMQTMFTTGLP